MVLACFSFWAGCCPNVARNLPSRFIAGGLLFLYDLGMEKLLETLEKIGIEPETIAKIKQADEQQARESALLLIAMFDDRRDYVG